MKLKFRKLKCRKLKFRKSKLRSKLLGAINKMPKDIKYKTMTGDCAVLAIALQRIFEFGDLVAIVSDKEPEYLIHVVLKIGNKYYDGYGERTKKQLLNGSYVADWEIQIQDEIQETGRWIRPKFSLVSVEEDEALKYTESTLGIDEMINIIKDLLS